MKNKTLLALFWSGVDKFSVVGIQIILDIVLARLLEPKDFGVLAILMIFVTFSQLLLDGGISNALIYNKDKNTSCDFSTAFIFNIIQGFLLYAIIFVSAPIISNFYQINLTLYLRVFAISIIFNAFSLVYRTMLSIDVNFKKQAKFSLLSILIAGSIALFLAYSGYGIWSLVSLYLTQTFFNSLFLMISSTWRPQVLFDFEALKRLLRYGWKLMLSAIINSIYVNFYTALIGKVYSSRDLGIYSKSFQMSIFPVSMITGVMQRVFFPVLVGFNNNYKLLGEKNSKILRLSMFLFFPLIAFLYINSEFIVITLLTEKWVTMILPFKILLLASLFYPLIIINMNVFQVIGNTRLYLNLEVINKVIGIVILFFTMTKGITIICYGILLLFFIQFMVTEFISKLTLGIHPLHDFKFFVLHVLVILALIYLKMFFPNLNLNFFYFLIYLFLIFIFRKNLIIKKA